MTHNNLHANMAEAKAWLIHREISFRQVTRYQLKIGRRISYYPSKETTFVDGEEAARTLTGLHGLEAVLREFSYLRAYDLANPTFESLAAEGPDGGRFVRTRPSGQL
jgi:hypothetical protein